MDPFGMPIAALQRLFCQPEFCAIHGVNKHCRTGEGNLERYSFHILIVIRPSTRCKINRSK